MKYFCFILILSTVTFNAFSQRLSIGVNYAYLLNPKWDKMIQTYNFNHPFLNEKQPLLMNGISADVNYFFKSEKKIKKGLNLSYSNYRSYTENTSFNCKINLHLIDLGYFIKLNHFDSQKAYSLIGIDANLGGIFKQINDNGTQFEEKRAKGLGIGGSLKYKFAYKFKLGEKHSLSPYFNINYSPYYFSPNTEMILNNTKTIVSKNYSTFVQFKIGVAFDF